MRHRNAKKVLTCYTIISEHKQVVIANNGRYYTEESITLVEKTSRFKKYE